MNKTLKAQTFNDGICAIYSVQNGAPRGYKPVKELVLKHPLLRYAENKVGLLRFWNARQSNVAVDKVVRVPRQEDISTQDVAILENGQQYDILQVQYVVDSTPESIDLSLERRSENYDIEPVP